MKYWIEEVCYDCSHGNRWFVFTKYTKYIISIPYHAYVSAYLKDAEYDFAFYREAWDEWLSYTVEQRREYIREFRRKKQLSNFEQVHKAMVNHAFSNMFVTFPPATVAGCDAMQPNKKENEMNEFYHERSHLETDLRKSYNQHEATLNTKHHLTGISPKSMAHVVQLIKDGKYDHADDEKQMNKEYKYDNPLYMFTFREHKADYDAHAKDTEKLQDAYRAAKLKVNTLPPAEGLKVAEAFRTLH